MLSFRVVVVVVAVVVVVVVVALVVVALPPAPSRLCLPEKVAMGQQG